MQGKIATALTPASRHNPHSSTNPAIESRATPGIDSTGSGAPPPARTKSGWIRSPLRTAVSRTSSRIAGDERLRRIRRARSNFMSENCRRSAPRSSGNPVLQARPRPVSWKAFFRTKFHMDILFASALDSTLGFFIKGGFFMILLLVLSVVALTVILQRGLALRESNVIPDGLEDEVQRLEPGDELSSLTKLIHTKPSPLGRVLLTLLRHLTWPKSENAEAVQTQARHETARMESGLVILEITTNVAPLFGLLGTLSGLVGIFANIGSGDPMIIARGISEALNTTIMGLAVAVPSIIAHNYYMRKIEVMAVEMESVTAQLLAKCYPNPGEQPTIQPVE